jgi:lipopolysaccharide/colanic/teichoic acid biosynthesis glycosyltransferase
VITPSRRGDVASEGDGQVQPLSLPAPDAGWSRKTPPALFARLAKRALDIFGAGLALIALAPLMVVIAVAIRVDSRGPSLFHQVRIGREGRPFKMLKFRTMVADAEERRLGLVPLSRDPDWLLLDRDPRITRVGRVLRRTSLDELPQLLNVLRGRMSLVGPRPLIPAEHARVPDWARLRMDVAPGMTGLWQVSGRTTIPFVEMLALDCRYVATWSAWGDIALLIRTVPAVLSRRGAT